MKIGVLDSGVGGFSILAVLEKQFPEYSFVYLSDHKNFPYSEKSPEELQKIGIDNAQILISQGCNPIVIACNTLTVTALAQIRQTFPTHTFIGTVPAVKPAAEMSPAGAHIVVLATKNTAESTYLQELIAPWKDLHQWTLLGSTALVEAIENWDEEKIYTELIQVLSPIQESKQIDAIVLGCTHFPFVERFITRVLQLSAAYQQTESIVRSPSCRFFEPSIGITKQLARAVEAVQTQQPPSSVDQPADRSQLFFMDTSAVSQDAAIVSRTLEKQYLHLKENLLQL